jgi:hypothetical protein
MDVQECFGQYIYLSFIIMIDKSGSFSIIYIFYLKTKTKNRLFFIYKKLIANDFIIFESFLPF